MFRWLQQKDLIVQGKRLLRLYSYYSLFLALLLLITDSIDSQNIIMGGRLPHIFLIASSLYVVIAALFAAVASREPDPQQATSYVFIETALLVTLMHASGGLETGFSSLILIPVVIANLLAPGILGYGVAAWTTIAVLYSQHIAPFSSLQAQEVVNSGLYGALCFVLAWVTQTLSRRLNSALTLASDQADRLQRLQRLSQQALLELPEGIIACDANERILFFNRRVNNWFNLQEQQPLPATLQNIQGEVHIANDQSTLIVRKIRLSGDANGDFLLQIEDSSRISAQAQQLKLASLGRLTASIAHEIRNPLSALRQASQLLSESPEIGLNDLQLTRMIEQHSMRINRTIEDILQLSKRRQSVLQPIELSVWLSDFARLFRQLTDGQQYQLNIHCPQNVKILFDPNQLQQVLDNLCANGLRYAIKSSPDNARLTLVVTPVNSLQVQLDVIDNGSGVAGEQRAHLFEPFYTTEHHGTGLGLYMCRELCEANQANIQYHPIPNGTCFRILLKNAPIQE